MTKIIAFHGFDHKVGTTQIAQCVSERIAALNPKLDVLLVLSDGGQGCDYCQQVAENFVQIRPYIAQSILNGDVLKARAKCKDNLYIVGGNETPEFSDLYTFDLAEKFLENMRDYFDLIIVDSGSDINIDCCVASVVAADRRYLVLRQCESALRRFEWKKTFFDKFDLSIDGYIMNCFNPRSLYEMDYISERLLVDEDRFILIRDCGYGLKSEFERKSLLELRPTKAFVKDIDKIVKDISEYAGI